ncbi:5-formyltetrahydrofolate cyclo-ligase [Legionella quinlivanii]|uniref:5-formyltetrahydrofolate cyclo-ligase n=1 Tax=Legionella quinlivanii TaxID=45073 RepID=A0A0W0XL69_9GAMM|nr:5-formyltetrahydrofolate cyclo-ligase [Legionella quinlivanii]KTD45425.1 5-formyltetrahydrofolate cyclo-ligase [Legionella quinlivanii]MCW8451287.1 5-formyltetrahydrofolate cyclo-ligase [Legionella quinlivanii]SEG33969.1 5-formyltetrahydrofolate cyclo-ligase [Legionella quinlivanii DSM 21216]STY10516.1 5-formyltetrahydrofolate cyclo-ligase [Legionella quinlivanii]
MADRLKRSMREVYRGIRERLPLEYRRANSRRICNRIRQLAVFRNARHIALYHAANGEVDLHDIWRSVPLQGKYCYFPVIRPDRNMHFMPATPATLFARNKHNIHEPQVESGKEINIHQLDLILLPLVAFDDYGTRLGMGGGYYDKCLDTIDRPLTIGVAYELQHTSFIKPDEWDVKMSIVVTEEKTYWIK